MTLADKYLNVAPVKGGDAAITAVHRMTTAILHAQQFLHAFIEFVIPSCREIKAHHTESLNSRLVMEQGGLDGTGANHIASSHPDGIWIFSRKVLYIRGQEGRTSGPAAWIKSSKELIKRNEFWFFQGPARLNQYDPPGQCWHGNTWKSLQTISTNQ
jgi:hypothetical protein